MARAAAIVLLALVAVCLVADVAAQTPFCRTSAYKLSLSQVRSSKDAMFKNCDAVAKVEVTSATMVGDCAVIIQKVADEKAWKAYSNCEKSMDNKTLYAPLKEASAACKALQKEGAC